MRGIRWFALLVVVAVSVAFMPMLSKGSSESSSSSFSLASVPYSLEYSTNPIVSHNPDAGPTSYNKIDPSTWGKTGCRVRGVKVAVDFGNLYLEVKLHPQDSFGNYKYVITISEIPTTRWYKQLKIELDPRSNNAHIVGSSISTVGFGPMQRERKVLLETTLARCVDRADQRTLEAVIPLNRIRSFVSSTELLKWRTGLDVIYSLHGQEDIYYLTGDSVGFIWSNSVQGFTTWDSGKTEKMYPVVTSKEATVVTCNTQYAGAPVYMIETSYFHWDWFDAGYRIPRIEEFLKGAEADIIGFQECVGWQPGGMFEYVPAELSRRLKMNYVVGDAFNGWSVALFTRFKILETEVYTGNDTFRNATLRANLEISPGITVTVFVVHVDCRAADASAVMLSKIVEPYVSDYAIVMGDFNQGAAIAGPHASLGLAAMHRQGWVRAASCAVDYVYFSPSLALHAVPAMSAIDLVHALGHDSTFLSEISDHWPVIAKVSFQQ